MSNGTHNWIEHLDPALLEQISKETWVGLLPAYVWTCPACKSLNTVAAKPLDTEVVLDKPLADCEPKPEMVMLPPGWEVSRPDYPTRVVCTHCGSEHPAAKEADHAAVEGWTRIEGAA